MANISSGESDGYIIGVEEKLAYVVVCGLTALCAVVANAVYLGCYINDQKLKCCFHMFVANIALCDIGLALAMMSLNVIVLFQINYTLCEMYRVIIFFMKQETSLLLVLIAYDRKQLICSVMHYRQAVSERRNSRMLLLTWLLCIVLNAAYGVYRAVPHGEETRQDFQRQRAKHCHASPTYRVDWFIVLQLALDMALAGFYLHIVQQCRTSNDTVSSLHSSTQERRHSSTSALTTTRLYGRDTAARALNCSPQPKNSVTSRSIRAAGLDPGESAAGEDWMATVAASAAMVRKSGDAAAAAPAPPDGDGETVDEEDPSPANGEGFDDAKHRRSVTFTQKALGASLKQSWTASSTTEQPSHHTSSALSGPIRNSASAASNPRSRSFDKSRGEWPFGRPIQSVLPRLLAKPSSSTSYRSEWLAAQQMGLFLLAQILCLHPVLLARLLASAMTDGASAVAGFAHWLDWLALLRTCLFPLIYWMYSPRIRDHCYWYLCLCRCRHSLQVVPDTPTKTSTHGVG